MVPSLQFYITGLDELGRGSFVGLGQSLRTDFLVPSDLAETGNQLAERSDAASVQENRVGAFLDLAGMLVLDGNGRRLAVDQGLLQGQGVLSDDDHGRTEGVDLVHQGLGFLLVIGLRDFLSDLQGFGDGLAFGGEVLGLGLEVLEIDGSVGLSGHDRLLVSRLIVDLAPCLAFHVHKVTNKKSSVKVESENIEKTF